MAATASPPTFADDLRDWRRRRSVSQLELALRAGTTQRHVSFIERGRSAPGRAMVIRLAEALEVPLRHRNALLLRAGYAPAYPERPLDDPELHPVRAALERILEGHLPCPAVLTDRDANLVSANAAFGALVAGADRALLAPPVNVPRLLLHPGGLGARIVNRAQWGRHVVDAVRRTAQRTAHPGLDALAGELEDLLPPRAGELPGAELGVAVPLVLRGRDGADLRLLTTLAHFGTGTDVAVSELTLEAFLPADEATARALLTAGSRAPS
jgi:transcriptional regulator with XRE-family HTH domain